MADRAWKTRLRQWILRDRERAGRLLVAGLCLLLAAVVLLLALVFRRETPAEESSAVAESTSEWPDCELTAGLVPPEQGAIVAVRQTDSSVAVYFTEVTAESVRAYLQSMGFSVPETAASDTSPYVAYADGRIIAVEYEALEQRLSLTVVKE